MTADTRWRPFGISDEEYGEPDAHRGVRVLNLRLAGRRGQKDRAAAWLRNAMIALGLLAAAAAVVSFEAQYRMVFAAKHVRAIAALEAAIPDVSAVVFAALGIALALQGKRALRPRALNVAAVATSIGMNYLAAAAGWRGAAIWVMPSVAYAVASDTAIGVIRAYVIARQRQLAEDLADDETTPLAVLAGLLLWFLRLLLAPASTLTGFRSWVVEEVKVAPGRRAALPGGHTRVAALSAAPPPGSAGTATRSGRRRGGSKCARLVEAYEALSGCDDRYGDRSKVSQVAKELAPVAGLQWGSARSTLYRHLDAKAEGAAS